jgi:hypothetical protein
MTSPTYRKAQKICFFSLKFFPPPAIKHLGKFCPRVPAGEVLMGSVASVLSAATLTAAAVNELVVDVGFSTTIAGKTYQADVTYTNGEYLAEDASLPGAVATGGSVITAENNLAARIDVLV